MLSCQISIFTYTSVVYCILKKLLSTACNTWPPCDTLSDLQASNHRWASTLDYRPYCASLTCSYIIAIKASRHLTQTRCAVNNRSILYQGIVIRALSTLYGRFTLQTERNYIGAILTFISWTQCHFSWWNTCGTKITITTMGTKLHEIDTGLAFITGIQCKSIIDTLSTNSLWWASLTINHKGDAAITSQCCI